MSPKITKAYTKTGDDGTTLAAFGIRGSKGSRAVEAIGAIDEASCAIGVVLSFGNSPYSAALEHVQQALFNCGCEVYQRRQRAGPQITHANILQLEDYIDDIQETLQPLENFILPGGSRMGALLHSARAAVRRAERTVARLGDIRDQINGKVHENVGIYLNRLSSFLFVLARSENRFMGVEDVLWKSS